LLLPLNAIQSSESALDRGQISEGDREEAEGDQRQEDDERNHGGGA
jgi:hypothetical protein